VSLIPAADLLEAVAIRQLLEDAVVRQAALSATPSSLAMLDAMLLAQRECADADDREGFHREDEGFHAKLAEIANMSRYWAVAQLVKLQLDRFRRLTLPAPGRMHAVIKEHEIIVDALRLRDPEMAAQALKDHLAFLLEAIEALKLTHPELFF
jgi:DNA-binding GntR family transcriptional regulator